MPVSIEEFTRSCRRLKEAIEQEKNEFTRDSVIQRFEFSIELAWKTSKKVMGTTTTAPKQIIREMAQNKLISDVDLWLEAIEQRNLSSYTYNEDLAEKVYNFVVKFYPELEKLSNQRKD